MSPNDFKNNIKIYNFLVNKNIIQRRKENNISRYNQKNNENVSNKLISESLSHSTLSKFNKVFPFIELDSNSKTQLKKRFNKNNIDQNFDNNGIKILNNFDYCKNSLQLLNIYPKEE